MGKIRLFYFNIYECVVCCIYHFIYKSNKKMLQVFIRLLFIFTFFTNQALNY